MCSNVLGIFYELGDPASLPNPALQILVVGADDVTSMRSHSGVDAIICIHALVLASEPVESSQTRRHPP